jgi:hypothetical protein
MPIHLALERDSAKPVLFESSRLAHHSAVLAQSGSGKSFMLGRLVEEILINTKARVVIFDPNSDFIRLRSADPKSFSDAKLKPWLFPSETLSAFNTVWSSIRIVTASNRNLEKSSKLAIDWGNLDDYEMAAAMNIDLRTDSDLFWCLFLASQFSRDSWDKEEIWDFEHFRDNAEKLVEYLLTGRGPKLVKTSPLAQTLRKAIGQQTALRFRAIVESLAEYQTWRSVGDGETDISGLVPGSDNDVRALVVDLQSLSTDEEKTAVATRVITTIWNRAKRELWEAVRDHEKADNRVPTFIVIDEAHNLVPAERGNPSVTRLGNQVVKVAAEGRKYGLQLIVVTQRPRKIDSNVLSECENVVLMKMSNASDVEFANDVFGFLPSDVGAKVKTFKVGDMLVAGALNNSSEVLHACPRRTVQGGKSLVDAYWSIP